MTTRVAQMPSSRETGSVASTSTDTLALNFQGVSCRFAQRNVKGEAYSVLDAVDLNVAAGEFVSVVGPTGCGKSTLLNLAAGLLEPSAGSVEVFGKPLVGVNRQAGYMFQSEALMPWKNALANVTLGLELRGMGKSAANDLGRDWLRRVGLGSFEERFPYELSGGMRKRVSLAQTLVLDPDIILMDEPFAALDIQTRQLMENEVLELWNAKRKAVLFITHDLDEAIALSDRVVVLSAGPGTRPIGNFRIGLDRPRDVAAIRALAEFARLHATIWDCMKDEVLRGYQRQMQARAT
jgi:NitT/TauT family transport system ATP-binding protein